MVDDQAQGSNLKRRQRVMSFLQPCLLFLLTRGESHGYRLLEEIREFGFERDELDVSVVYRILRNMEKSGCVESRWDEDSRGPRRRVYRILPTGEEYLAIWIEELHRTRDEIDCLLGLYQAQSE